MARGRMLDKVVILSKKVNAISEGAENLFYRVNTCADDYGRYFAEPAIIKGQIYTLRDIKLKEITRRVDELWKANLIELYYDNGETYLAINNFEKHQTFKPDRPKKKEYPDPVEFLKRPNQNGPVSKMEPGGIHLDTNGRLSKDKLSKDKLTSILAEKSALSEIETKFQEFWETYPKEGRHAKGESIKKFAAIYKKGRLADLIKGFHGYLDFLKAKKVNENFSQRPMYAKTFLNGRWEEFIGYKYEPRL